MSQAESQDSVSSPHIRVSEIAWGEISPSSAYAHLTLAADKLFSDRSALSKAEELRRLALDLEARGLPAGAISLEGVTLDVSTGLFSRSSSVHYRVRIEIKDLERLPEVLDVIASAKKATLSHLTWDYTESAPTHLLESAARRAMQKARALAVALEVKLGEPRSVREERLDDDANVFPQSRGYGKSAVMSRSRGGGIASELAGLDLTPKKKVGVRVILECVIARG